MTKRTPHDAAPAVPLAWSHDVAEVTGAGFSEERTATAAELQAVAAALDLMACERLSARYRIRAIAGGGYRLSGTLTADVVQACVVTLEPVPAHLEVPFDVEYWPDGEGDEAAAGSEEISALSAAEIEPLENGRVDAGRIVYEQLAAGLDPYPRKAGAEFVEPQSAGEAAANPFAVLKRLQEKP